MDPQIEERDQDFARAVLQARAERLVNELTSLKRRVRKESIHDTRVWSRRMRAALEAFQDLFPPRPWKSLYGSVRKVTRTLGRPRETEVTLALLQELSTQGDMAENISCEYLMEKLEARLAKLKMKMKEDLESLDARSLTSKIDFLLSGMGSTEGLGVQERKQRQVRIAGGRKSAGAESQPTLFPLYETSLGRGRRIISEASVPILKFRGRYDFPRAGDDELHALRISAKKLRYAMEIFNGVWPEGLKEETAMARGLQNAGGEFHDWCILSQMLKDDIRRMTKKRTSHMAFQLGRLLAHVEDRRAELRSKILPALIRLQVGLQSIRRERKAEVADQATDPEGGRG
jgi:CHAD domain-containing protein